MIRKPAPPELVEQAEALAREHHALCLWFRHPDSTIRYIDDVRLVVQHLREYGDRKTWRAAQDLWRAARG